MPHEHIIESKVTEIVRKYVRRDELDQAYLCGEPQYLKKDILDLLSLQRAEMLSQLPEELITDWILSDNVRRYNTGWNDYRNQTLLALSPEPLSEEQK